MRAGCHLLHQETDQPHAGSGQGLRKAARPLSGLLIPSRESLGETRVWGGTTPPPKPPDCRNHTLLGGGGEQAKCCCGSRPAFPWTARHRRNQRPAQGAGLRHPEAAVHSPPFSAVALRSLNTDFSAVSLSGVPLAGAHVCRSAAAPALRGVQSLTRAPFFIRSPGWPASLSLF